MSDKHNLTVLYYNARSLPPKIDYLIANCEIYKPDIICSTEVVSSGRAPTPAGTSVFTKHNWDMGMGYLWLNGWGIYGLMGGAFIT